MFIDKIVELYIYREACVHGLPVSLSLSHLNGRESFTSIPGPDLAGPGRNAAAVPVEGVEGEVAETMERAQTSKLMPRPPTRLLPGRRRCRFCRALLSALGSSMPLRI